VVSDTEWRSAATILARVSRRQRAEELSQVAARIASKRVSAARSSDPSQPFASRVSRASRGAGI
jgi:hypothetical protein